MTPLSASPAPPLAAPPLGCRALSLSAALLAGLSLGLALLPRQALAYDIVSRSRGVVTSQGLGQQGESIVAMTAAGPVRLPVADVDFYETFRKNLGREGGRVLAFRSGSILRFDSLVIEAGILRLGLSEGTSFSVPESLVDFQSTVIEGATVRGSASVPATVVVARPGDSGGASGLDAADLDEAARIPTNPARARRLGRPGFPPPGSGRRAFPASAGVAEALAEGDPSGATEQPDVSDTTADTPGQEGGSGGEEASPEQSDPESARSSRFRNRGEQTETVGTVVLVAHTNYAGDDIQGLQITIRYPPGCTVVTPVGFSGFAAQMTAVPNTQNPLRVAGVLPAIGETLKGPGEFLRVAFSFRGEAPRLEDFSLLAATAADSTSANVAGFRAELSLQ